MGFQLCLSCRETCGFQTVSPNAVSTAAIPWVSNGVCCLNCRNPVGLQRCLLSQLPQSRGFQTVSSNCVSSVGFKQCLQICLQLTQSRGFQTVSSNWVCSGFPTVSPMLSSTDAIPWVSNSVFKLGLFRVSNSVFKLSSTDAIPWVSNSVFKLCIFCGFPTMSPILSQLQQSRWFQTVSSNCVSSVGFSFLN